MDLKRLSQAVLSKTFSQSQAALPPMLSQVLHQQCPCPTQQPRVSLGAQADSAAASGLPKAFKTWHQKMNNLPMPAPPGTIFAPQGPSCWVWTTTLPSPGGHFGSEVVFIPQSEQITPLPGQGCIWGCRIGFMEGFKWPLPFPDRCAPQGWLVCSGGIGMVCLGMCKGTMEGDPFGIHFSHLQGGRRRILAQSPVPAHSSTASRITEEGLLELCDSVFLLKQGRSVLSLSPGQATGVLQQHPGTLHSGWGGDWKRRL